MSQALAVRTARGRVPLLGHAPAIKRNPLEFVRSLRQYGDITRIFVGPRRILVVNSPELIRRILVNDARKFDKGALFDKARAYLGNGLLTSTGDFHRRQRRLAQPAFHAKRIDRYAELMIDQASTTVDAWADGATIEMTHEIDRLALRILLRTMFAGRPTDEVRSAIVNSMSTKHGSMWRSLSPIPAWIDRLTGGADGPMTVERTELPELYEVLARLVRERRSQSADDGDLVSMLATATDPATGERMTDAQVCEELVTLFVAATETASAALTWTFHELARHPDIERRLHDEVDSVLGGRRFTAADIGKLGYTRRVVQEVLRRYAAWLLMRRVVAPVELDGIELAPGAEVYYSPYALHHDPELYPEPDVFDPDRWLPERSAGLPRGAFIPFGAGNRLCMGEGYAWAELVIVLAAVTARWRLEPASGHEVRPRIGTLIEADRLPMTLHKRH